MNIELEDEVTKPKSAAKGSAAGNENTKPTKNFDVDFGDEDTMTKGDGFNKICTPDNDKKRVVRMTPLARPYCNWEAVHRVLATAQWMHADGLCTPTAMTAMTVIARHLNATTGVAFASYETFWDEGGIPRSTVKRTLNKLVQAGYPEHPPDTYRYKLGPKVQTFTEEKSTAKKPSTQQAADPPATSRMSVKFDIK